MLNLLRLKLDQLVRIALMDRLLRIIKINTDTDVGLDRYQKARLADSRMIIQKSFSLSSDRDRDAYEK